MLFLSWKLRLKKTPKRSAILSGLIVVGMMWCTLFKYWNRNSIYSNFPPPLIFALNIKLIAKPSLSLSHTHTHTRAHTNTHTQRHTHTSSLSSTVKSNGSRLLNLGYTFWCIWEKSPFCNFVLTLQPMPISNTLFDFLQLLF